MCPIYEYYCEACNKTIEKLVKLSESDTIQHCEECENILTKQYSCGNFKLKGEGFYSPSKDQS